MTRPQKLIEVALPLAACRAVLFVQMVDDPASHPDLFPTAEEQEAQHLGLEAYTSDLNRRC